MRLLRALQQPRATLSALWARRSYRAQLRAAQEAAARTGTAPPAVFHVTMKRQRHVLRNLALGLGALYVAHTAADSIVRRTVSLHESAIRSWESTVAELDENDDDEDAYDDDYDDDDDDDDDDFDANELSDDEFVDAALAEAVLIPLPYSFSWTQPPPYRADSPEWRTFVRISRSREERQAIAKQLVRETQARVASHAQLAAHMGPRTTVGHSHFHFFYPTQPPPVSEHLAFAVSRRSLGIVHVRPDPELESRVRRVLWPVNFAVPAYAFCKSLAQYHWKGASRTPGTPGTPGTSTSLPASPSASPSTTSGHPSTTSGHPFLIDAMRPAVKEASAAFVATYTRMWRPHYTLPPRGSVVVRGTVDLVSPKLTAMVVVKAHYDPKTKTFHKPTFDCKVDVLQPRVTKAMR